MSTIAHILRPQEGCVVSNRKGLARLIQSHRIVTAGVGAPEGKLKVAEAMNMSWQY